MTEQDFVRYEPERLSEEEMSRRSAEFHSLMNARRSVRAFSSEPVSREIMENLIRTASTAPSGAHMQPWTFCMVSNMELKRRTRELAEKEEKENYDRRMGRQWLADLEPLGITWEKEFLVGAPWLIVVMKHAYRIGPNGEKLPNYYVNESVGIAVGFLVAAIHNAGLATLTYTPSPMGFLARLLERPENERPYMVLPVGRPTPNVVVPDLKRKSLAHVAEFYE